MCEGVCLHIPQEISHTATYCNILQHSMLWECVCTFLRRFPRPHGRGHDHAVVCVRNCAWRSVSTHYTHRLTASQGLCEPIRVHNPTVVCVREQCVSNVPARCTYFLVALISLLRKHTAIYCNILQHTATYGNILQHAATHCNTLQHTESRCNINAYINVFAHIRTHTRMCVLHTYAHTLAHILTRTRSRAHTQAQAQTQT